jgi:hypothetical protein
VYTRAETVKRLEEKVMVMDDEEENREMRKNYFYQAGSLSLLVLA